MARELERAPEATPMPREILDRPLFESPFFRMFSREMERFFDEFGGTRGAGWLPRAVREAPWAPDLEVVVDKDVLIVRADLPGISPEEVHVEVADDRLVVKGERKREFTEEKKDYYRTERTYGQFARTIPLPEGAIGEGARATFVNGVLEVRIPVPPRAEPKARQVKVEAAEVPAPKSV